ncbi:hypothetical protein [Actinokineospora iranica]|uniref:Uncharacterized protein n=1 Tax=Actinokineospora iranica TaxID=1271860 RepID=A0A1G6KKI4_9PSEU|nr:hypothetical protein [Actinokineospora iranica]SDC30836.1 hypothetical protein SAMN05216174_101934 [Actinokineospora iranica]
MREPHTWQRALAIFEEFSDRRAARLREMLRGLDAQPPLAGW